MSDIFERSKGLIGSELFEKLKGKTIVIFGLGGVGGTALECLARSGFENFILVDFDSVASSNLNRQILFTENELGNPKIEAAKARISAINKNVNIRAICSKISSNLPNFLDSYKIDFIIDAIDDVNGKISIIKYATDRNIPFIVSLGMANRLDPSKVYLTTINHTKDDPLAKKMRYILRKENVDLKKVNCVISSELPKKDGNKLNSMMMVPSSAGLNISYFVIEYFTNN